MVTWVAHLFFKLGLMDCCEHPASALSLLLTYPCPPACGADHGKHGMPFCLALKEAVPGTGRAAEPVLVVAQRPPQHMECTEEFYNNICWLPFLPIPVLLGVTMAVAGIISCCGFPCRDETVPPLGCLACFNRRRLMVRMLGADEHHVKNLGADEDALTSRCAVVFCCALSELQVWREAHYSGVWPGLACRAATDDELQRMSSRTVRQRYGVGREYGARCGPRAHETTRYLLADGEEPALIIPDPSSPAPKPADAVEMQ